MIIGASLLGIAILLLIQRNFGEQPEKPSRRRIVIGYVFAGLWGIYGGLFSGGYMIVLTMSCVTLFGQSLLRATAITKWVNLVSSATATIVFISEGAINFRAGIPYALAAAVGGWTGAHLATRYGSPWIRKVLIGLVVAMAAVLLGRAWLA